jgi:hypothetical protein
MVEITAAAVRLFNRAVVIEFEVEEQITYGREMTNEELIAWGNRLLSETADAEYDEKRKVTKAALKFHREYQWVKAELGKQLQLKPDDINPLDITFDQEWASPDDPRIAIWKRSFDIYRHLTLAHNEWLCWWRPKEEPSGNVVRLRPESKIYA